MKFDPGRSLRLAADLRRLQAASREVKLTWNPSIIVIVRIVLDERMPDTQRSSSAINAFVRRAGFDFGGATKPTVRLFHSTIDNLGIAAAEFERKPNLTRGKAFIERYAGIQQRADVHREVGKAKVAERALEICYHILDDQTGEAEWAGIAAMAADLGGRDAQKWTHVGGLGFGSVVIDHAQAAEIARHPLVRHVSIVPQLRTAAYESHRIAFGAA